MITSLVLLYLLVTLVLPSVRCSLSLKELVSVLSLVFVLVVYWPHSYVLVLDPLGTSSSRILVDVLVLVLGHLGVAFPWILLDPFRHYQ